MILAYILFLMVCLYVIIVFFHFVRQSTSRRFIRITLAIFVLWILFSGAIGLSGFASDFSTVPPKFAVIIIPAFAFTFLFSFSKGIQSALGTIPPFLLVAFQAFRIFVEIVLWLLYTNNVIPVQMTFEGLNFDILAGVSAPIIAYLCFKKQILSLKVLQIWNYISLLLLCNILFIALTSTPTVFKIFMNEPANTVVASFPYVWLPAFVAPMAMVGHILSIRQLSLLKQNSTHGA